MAAADGLVALRGSVGLHVVNATIGALCLMSVSPMAQSPGLPSERLLPSGFVENLGQWPTSARFVARRGQVLVRAEPGGLVLQRDHVGDEHDGRASVLRLRFGSDSPEPVPAGEPIPGVSNFLIGSNPSGWRTGARQYDLVEYADIAPGAIARIQWLSGGVPTLGLHVSQPAEWDGIVLLVDGISAVQCGDQETVGGPDANVLQLALSASPGELQPRAERVSAGKYRVTLERGGGEVPTSVELPLVWSTYLGGDEGLEFVHDLVRTAEGNPIVLGMTRADNFPVTPGAFQQRFAGAPPPADAANDIFVSKLAADGGALVYSTYLGGYGQETPGGMSLSKMGEVTVVGSTFAADFPTTPGAFDVVNGVLDAFVARLTAEGDTLVFSSFLGAEDIAADQANDVVETQDGRLVICGETTSTSFPTTPGALQLSNGGYFDGFLAVLDPTAAQLLYSTYLGGVGDERARGLALRDDGSVVVTGRNTSPTFPVTPGAFDSTMGTEPEDFALALDPDTSDVLYSTLLGPCTARAVAAHSDGSVVIVGRTSEPTFITTPGAFDTTYKPGVDGFVMRLNSLGTAQVYSTLLGGAAIDDVLDVVVDSAGRATVVGSTYSGSFPYTPGSFPWPPPVFGPPDYFVTRLKPDGSGLLYSTNLGGPVIETELHAALAVDETGAAFVAGGSIGQFPVTEGAFDTTEPVSVDATVSLLTMLPTGVSRFGASTAGGNGPLAIDVTMMPALGAGHFALTCTNAPPSSTKGLLVLGFAGLPTPLVGKGIDLWVDPSPALFLFPAESNSDGYAVVSIPIPADPRLEGVGTAWQFVWAPEFVGRPWSASNALQVVIQP